MPSSSSKHSTRCVEKVETRNEHLMVEVKVLVSCVERIDIEKRNDRVEYVARHVRERL